MCQLETKPNAERAKNSKETIFVVDDQEIVLDYVASVLTGANYHVVTALGPELALNVSESYPRTIHLLLTDYQMPAVNGLELAGALTKNRPQLRVLVMSGCDQQEVPPHPGWAFIQKPFRSDALLNLVAEVLAGEASIPERAPVGRAELNGYEDKRKVG